MLTLHVEAPTFKELVDKAASVLHANISVAFDDGKPEPQPMGQTATLLVVDEASEQPKTKRGRPRKNTESAPAGAPEVPAARAAVASNTASAPADMPPPAEGAGQQATGATEPLSVAAPSPDKFRAKLQQLSESGQDGYTKVVGLLEEFKCKKVKDVPPEQYAAIMARADELLAKAA